MSTLETQGSALPERVSKILAGNEEEIREGKQSVATLLQRQTGTQRYLSELRTANAEHKAKGQGVA